VKGNRQALYEKGRVEIGIFTTYLSNIEGKVHKIQNNDHCLQREGKVKKTGSSVRQTSKEGMRGRNTEKT